MNRLEEQFSDRVDFFVLDVDLPETEPVRRKYDLFARSQYLLIDANGNELKRWFGPLNEQSVTAEIESILEQIAAGQS